MALLKVGDNAPHFRGKIQDGSEITLADFAGKRLIIYFYPKDLTPGCTVESCNFRDNYSMLLDKGFAILGVSADDEKKHQKFIEKHNLPFPLLADTEKEVIEAFGVWGLKKFMGKEYMGINRTTFVIGTDGKIELVVDKVKTKNHTQQILELLNEK